jgi:hypothetical protein
MQARCSRHRARRPLSRRQHPALRFLGIAATVLLCALLRSQPVQAAGFVTVCNESALDAALNDGGTITFLCDGIIPISETKVITRDTTLDGTGQQITLQGQGVQRVFDVRAGASLTIRNLTVIEDSGASDGPTKLPATGYPPRSSPPSEWIFVGLGGIALILVSTLGSFMARPRSLRPRNQG